MATDLSGQQKTPFFRHHVDAGARMVDFGGWAMPVQYTGILAEHRAVREQAGLFDVSHMGEFLVEGSGALAFLQRLTTNDVAALAVGQAHYTLALTESGGIVDDLLVYRRGPDRFLICVNAACIPADWQWFRSHHDPARDDCTLENASSDFAQLAIQGRKSLEKEYDREEGLFHVRPFYPETQKADLQLKIKGKVLSITLYGVTSLVEAPFMVDPKKVKAHFQDDHLHITVQH